MTHFWFVAWVRDYPAWALTTLLNVALAAFVWLRGCRGSICITQTIVAALSVYLVGIGYSDCTQEFYRWNELAIDYLCAALEGGIALSWSWGCIRRRTATVLEMFGIISIFLHQEARTIWNWASDLFQEPENPLITNARHATNIATIFAIGAVVYFQTRDSSLGDENARGTQAATAPQAHR